jgi:hypothetical protein
VPYAIWIERNDPIGFKEHHTEQHRSGKLDRKFVSNLLQEVSINSVEQEKSKRWTPDAKSEHIRGHANMHVLSQYKSQYEDLIIKHFNIVSIGKNYLGQVKNFFHKRHMKDNEPFYRKQFKIPDAHCPFLEESLADWL